MKEAAANSPTDILNQIETIEKDIFNLKLSVLKKFVPTRKKTIKLKGILKGIDITNEDILSVQKTLYGKVEL